MKQSLLSGQLGPLRLKNPVLAASGTFGYAQEFAAFYDVARLGGIVTKTITLRPRAGNPAPRIVDTPAGMLNAIGLQNVGVEAFLQHKLPYLAQLDTVIIVSIMATSTAELAELGARLDLPGVDALELNLSCPNVSYADAAASAVMFAPRPKADGRGSQRGARVHRQASHSQARPGRTVDRRIGRAACDAGADALAVMNTIPGMVIHAATGAGKPQRWALWAGDPLGGGTPRL